MPDVKKIINIRPLTHQNRKGVVYERAPEVESQIRAAITMEPDALIERVRMHGHQSSDFFQEETLIYLIRHYILEGHDKISNSLFESLMSRCTGFVYEKLKGLRDPYRDEAFNEVFVRLVNKIFDFKTDKGDFYQVRFWPGIEALAIDVFRQFYPEQKKDLGALRPAGIGGSDSDQIDEDNIDRTPLQDIPTAPNQNQKFLEIDDLNAIRAGLSAIQNSKHREAFILHYYSGWPIESIEPDKQTIRGRFNKTPKTIRTWLRIAEDDIRRWREGVK